MRFILHSSFFRAKRLLAVFEDNLRVAGFTRCSPYFFTQVTIACFVYMETSTHSSSAEATSSATSSADVGAAAASRPTALRHLDISSDATSEPLPNDTASYQTTPSAIKAAETEELKAWEEGQLAISREAEAARERELSEQLEKQAASDLYNWAMSAISGTIDKAEQYHDLMSNLPAIKHLLEDEVSDKARRRDALLYFRSSWRGRCINVAAAFIE